MGSFGPRISGKETQLFTSIFKPALLLNMRQLSFVRWPLREMKQMQKLHRLGQNSQSNLNRLWAKVYQILQTYRRPFIVKKSVFFRSSVPRLFWRYFPLTREVVQKSLKRRQFLGPTFLGGNLQILDDRFQTWLIFEHVAKFDWFLGVTSEEGVR